MQRLYASGERLAYPFTRGFYSKDIDDRSPFCKKQSMLVETMLSYREGKSEACSP